MPLALREVAAGKADLLRGLLDRLLIGPDVVTEIQCRRCDTWVSPRRFREPAGVCATCDAAGVVQTWAPGVTRG